MRHGRLIVKAATASILIGAANIPATQAQTKIPSPTGFHLLEATIDASIPHFNPVKRHVARWSSSI